MLTAAKKVILLGGGAFNPLSLSPWLFTLARPPNLYQTTGTTSPVAANNDPIGRDNDLSSHGFHVVQGTAGNRPLYQTGGKFALFDGVDDYLAVSYGSSLPQPFEYFGAFRVVAAGAGDVLVFDDIQAAAGVIAYDTADDTVHIYNGSVVHTPTVIGIGIDFVVSAVFNGASSGVSINNGAYTTGDAGAGTPTGLMLGNPSTPRNFRCYGFAIYPRVMTSAERAKLRTYFAALYGGIL